MIVVDTSVAIKWVVAEERRAEARMVLASGWILHAPDLMLLEAANTLRRKVRGKLISTEQSAEGFDLIRQSVTILTMRDQIDETMALAIELDHSVYDCCFLACALWSGSLFITDDVVFARKCQDRGYSENVLVLTDVVDGGLERAIERVPYVDFFSRLEAE